MADIADCIGLHGDCRGIFGLFWYIHPSACISVPIFTNDAFILKVSQVVFFKKPVF